MSSIYAVVLLVRLCIVQRCSLKWWQTSTSVTNTINQAISCKSQTYIPSLLTCPAYPWQSLPLEVFLTQHLWACVSHCEMGLGGQMTLRTHISCRMCAHLNRGVLLAKQGDNSTTFQQHPRSSHEWREGFLLCLSVSLLKVYLNSLAITIAYLSNGIELS